jgi:hypothetical protein
MRFPAMIAAAAFCLAPTALAADVYDEITIDQLKTILDASFTVEKIAATGGGHLLAVQGKNEFVGAAMLGCGTGQNCEGVRYFAPLTKSYTVEQANAYNRNPYAKIYVRSDGKASISFEVFAVGGITADNFARTAALLMVLKGEANGTVTSAVPSAPTPVANSVGKNVSDMFAIKGSTVAPANEDMAAQLRELNDALNAK